MPEHPHGAPEGRSSTIEQVAAAAGVSVATVSRALRGLPNVAPSTRAKVETVAHQMRYRADPSASRLAAGRTTTVALAVPFLDTGYFAQVMAGAQAVLSDEGYDMLVFAISTESRRRELLSGPLVKRADGLILASLQVADAEIAGLSSSGVPVTTIGHSVAGAGAVVVDDLAVGRSATEHLVALGHDRIGLISGVSPAPMKTPVPELRRRGYHEALAAQNVVARREYEVQGNFSIAGGFEAMNQLLDLPSPPTSVFAMSDDMAFGALRALKERGMQVPHDMSVVGVDNLEIAAVVALTTVDQQIEQHGAVAARLVLDQLGDPASQASSHQVGTALVVRNSTGPPSQR